MPGKAILLAGLPGSGKSTYARELVRNGAATFYVNDYYWKSRDNRAEFCCGREFCSMTEALRRGDTWVSSDVQWCKRRKRESFERDLKAEVPGVAVEWRFIVCDEKVCRDRIRLRGREGVRDAEKELLLLEELLAEYAIPQGEKRVVTDQVGGRGQGSSSKTSPERRGR
jgi:predicted kinase